MLKQDYNNDFFEFVQQKINFSFFELHLPDDDSVYILKKVMEDLDFSGLLVCYSDKGKAENGSLQNIKSYPIIKSLKLITALDLKF